MFCRPVPMGSEFWINEKYLSKEILIFYGVVIIIIYPRINFLY
jgi:hypothetical protein